MRFTKSKGCPFCHEKKFKRLVTKDLLSNIKCTGCGAVFVSLEIEDHDAAGKFTGIYNEITREQYLKTGSFNKGEQ